MAQRRPIASHPAFAPLVALWFAALFGLGVAVLPSVLLANLLAKVGFLGVVPEPGLARLAACLVAAILGVAIGWMVGRAAARRSLSDPRPVYTESEPLSDQVAAPAMRPLRVREDVEERMQSAFNSDVAGFEEAFEEIQASANASSGASSVPMAEADEGFMILTPQPSHPSRPDADLDGLIEQFDRAIAAFRGDGAGRADEGRGPDPVHAFVARQTGSPAPSTLGGQIPDHQAELRAALEKLARAHRVDE